MGLGLVGTLIAGGAVGVGEAGKQFGDYLSRSKIQEEAAAIARERDARLAELTSKYRREDMQFEQDLRRKPYQEAAANAKGVIGRLTEQQNAPVTEEAGGVGPTPPTNLPLDPRKAQGAKAEAYEEAGLPDVASTMRREGMDRERLDLERERLTSADTRDERQHTERMAAINRQIAQQDRQIKLEERKVGLLEANNALEAADKKVIRDARDAYLNEKDPEKKLDLAVQYHTLLGKAGERWQAVKENVNGENVTTGFIDTMTGRGLGPQGRGGGAAAPYPEGTELRGKDGKDYVVKNGVPVPKATQAADRSPAPASPKPAEQPKPESWRAAGAAAEEQTRIKDQMGRLTQAMKAPNIPQSEKQRYQQQLNELGQQLANLINER